MAAEQRKLLEQLMGSSSSSRAAQLSLNDPKVCRSFLVGTCPHDLFTNTKQDIGPCPKVHAEALKTEYEALSERAKEEYAFKYDYMRDLGKYIEDCNRRIDAAQRRLEKTPDEIRQTNSLLKSINELNESIRWGTYEAEVLGEESEVFKAMDEYYKVRQAMQTKADRERELKNLSDTSGPSGHQKLQVCDVCGAYLSRLDNDRRLADHFYGKMHLGYAQMRKTYEALSKELGGRPMPAASRDADGGFGGSGGGDGRTMGPRGPRGGFRGGRGGRGGFRSGY